MTVAAGIEIGAGGRSETGQNQLLMPGRTQGAAWSGARLAGSSPSSGAAVESFRSSWESLLASLDAGKNSLNGVEAETDATQTNTDGALMETAEGAMAGTASSAGRSSWPLEGGRTQRASGTTKLSAAGTRAGVALGSGANGVQRQPAARQAAKELASIRPASSSAVTSAASSSKSMKSDAASRSGGGARASVAATDANLSLALAAAENPKLAAKASEAQPRSVLSGLSDRDTSSISESIGAHSSLAGTDGRQAADGAGTGNQRGKTSIAAAADKLASGLAFAAAEAKDPGASGLSNPAGRGESAAGRTAAVFPLESDAGLSSQVQGQAATESKAQTRDQDQTGSRSACPSESQVPGLNQETGAVASARDSDAPGDSAAPAAGRRLNPSATVVPTTKKPGDSGEALASVQGTMRWSHATGLAEAAAGGAGKSAATAQDGLNPAMARDPAAVSGAIDTSANGSGESSGTAGSCAGEATREAFTALDAESASGAPRWIHAGAQRAEAGFQDPTLGWVGVRAEMGGSGVHAALVPGSADAAQALGGHLAGLNAYLAAEHTALDPVTVAAPEGGHAFNLDQGTSHSMDQGAGQGTGQGTGADARSSTAADAAVFTGAASPEIPAQGGMAETTMQAASPGGVHISVMA